MSLLDRAWEQREEVIYPQLFGDVGNAIYPLTSEMFAKQFNCEAIDPRWLHSGVFRSPPNNNRNTWLYISSGMSNPWEAEAEEEYSGLGTELILQILDDESWAIPLLQSLVAFNTLLSVGHYGDRPLLDYGDRIPQPIEPNISHLVMAVPVGHPESIQLLSGAVDLIQVMGVTQTEFEFARQHDSQTLCERLIEQGVYPVTNPHRESIVNV